MVLLLKQIVTVQSAWKLNSLQKKFRKVVLMTLLFKVQTYGMTSSAWYFQTCSTIPSLAQLDVSL